MAALRLPSAPVSLRAVWTFLRCAVACALIGVGMGSDAVAQEVRVGVRAGPTFGFLNDSAIPFVSAAGDATANTNVRLDLHAGAYAVVPISERYGLQAELLYVRKGGHFSRFREMSYRVERYRLSYVQAQALGRRNVSLPGPLLLHVVAGLTGKHLMGGTAQRAVHSEARVVRETIDLADQRLVRRWDVGALLGVGLGYPVGRTGRITLALRYNRGFRSVFTDGARPLREQLRGFEDPPPLTRVPPTLRHDAITASLSFTIALGR